MSAELAEVDHPIHRTGLHKIETGDRRVSVDDLVALALALDVTPGELLFGAPLEPEQVSDGDEIGLTATVGSAGVPVWSLRAGIVVDDPERLTYARDLRHAMKVLDTRRAIEREEDQ